VVRANDIASASELRTNLRKHIDRLKKSGRPLFVTTNGETDAVVLSADAFEELLAKAELAQHVASVERGLADAEAGRVRDFRRGVREVAARPGLKPLGEKPGR
jgi:prevent-host-death family protein